MTYCDDFDEDKMTIKYMYLYGLDNVRGGSFCRIKLNQEHTKMFLYRRVSSHCYK